MLTPEGAAALLSVSVRELYRAIEAGGLHFRERADGAVAICVESLKEVRSIALGNRFHKSKTIKEIES